MGAGLLASQLILVLCFTLFTLNKYANLRRQKAVIAAPTFFGWFFSFLIIIVLPLDVAITFYKKCTTMEAALANSESVTEIPQMGAEYTDFNSSSTSFCEEPSGYIEDKFLFRLWRIVYWGSQFLTWILLPMIQSYAKAGEFTTKGRLHFALYSNAIYYGIYFSLLTFLLIYIVSKGISLNFASLKILIVSASNTWGIFLLVILLGYGLIEVPRLFWRMGVPGYRLRRCYFEIDKLSSEKNESEEALLDVYSETKLALNLLKNSRGIAREKICLIAAKFPNEILTDDARNGVRASRSDTQLNLEVVSQDAYLVNLHRKVIRAVQAHQQCQIQWRSLMETAFYLEDVETVERLGGQLPKQWTIFGSGRNGQKKQQRQFFNCSFELPERLQFLWHCKLQRILFRFLAVVFATMTVLILWSECTFFISRFELSLAALLLHGLATHYHYRFIQICAISMILYLCICAYYTIFQLRIYRYYRLDSNGMTDDNSLIFSAMLICRLTAPLCLNFLGMIHLDSAVSKNQNIKIETQFTKLMGHLEIIPWLSEGINIYLPIVIVLLCFVNWFRLGTRFLHKLGIDQFLEEDTMTIEMVKGGRALVSLERNRLTRASNREERNKAWKIAKSEVNNLFTQQKQRENDDKAFMDVPYERELLPLSGNGKILAEEEPEFSLMAAKFSLSDDLLEFGPTTTKAAGSAKYQQLNNLTPDFANNSVQRNFFDDI